MTERAITLIRQLAARWKRPFGGWFGLLIAAGCSVLTACLWLWEHDAHLRQAYELGQVKRQTAANIAALQGQAEAAIREANQQHAQAVRELEAREQKFAQQAGELRARVAALQAGEHARLEQVATLPASELATRVAAQLGLSSGSGVRDSEPGARERTPINPNPESRPTSGAGTNPESGTPSPGIYMGESALRKVGGVLVELDSCRERGALLNKEVANLNDQLAAKAAVIGEHAAAIRELNQALQAKDQVLEQTEARHRAELKAARGTRLGRAGRALEHVAIGIVIGLILR